MAYIEGFLLAVPTDKREAYKRFAESFVPIYKELGAIGMTECWGDDVPDGKVTSFPMAVKAEKDETVVLAWIVWPSKEVRDEGNKKMLEHPRFKDMDPSQMPFDGMRMILGGFEVLLEA
ncbi:MAG: DUF1428 domain-containing protein [Hyphomicrobiales bacterium]|nr:DUF1428 domain-containing protein [Hyphomicrobiales bacterium]